MTQLYNVKGGSIGHYDDAYKAELCDMLNHLNLTEIKSYVNVLKSVEPVTSHEHEILDGALNKFKIDYTALVHLKTALETIASVEYSKHFSSNDEIRDPVRTLTKTYTGIAKKRGFVHLE